MSVPTVTPSNIKTPGVALSVNLLAGVSSPSSGRLKVLVLGVKATAGGGTLVVDTQLERDVGGPASFATLFGAGAPAHIASKALFGEYGKIAVDCIALTPGGGVAASSDYTFAGTVTVAWEVTLGVMGRYWTQTWAAGVSATVFAAAVAAQVSARTQDLCVVASASVGVLTVAAKAVGTWGNDIKVYIKMTGGTGGTVNGATTTLNVNLGVTIPGTAFADPTTALALAASREYHVIMLVDGNASVAISGSTSPYYKVNTHIALYNSGLGAHLQRQILGCTAAAMTTGNTNAGYRNTGTADHFQFMAAQSLPCEVQGAEVGARIREIEIDPACNRIRIPYRVSLVGPVDDVGDKPTPVEIEAALNAGNTPLDFGTDGVPFPVRPITTYAVDTAANPDDRLLDTSRVDATYIVARDLVVFATQRWPGRKIIADLVAGQELPRGCVEVKTIRSGMINRVRYWATIGVLRSDSLEEAITSGELIIERDSSNVSKINMVIPVKIVPPLANMDITVNHTGP